LLFQSRCAVIFFDEIDALGQSRENSGTGEGEGCSRRVLSELLLQLNVIADKKECSLDDFGSSIEAMSSTNNDGCEDMNIHPANNLEVGQVRIIVVAATNRVDDCDSALLRRFGIQLEVSLPSLKDRIKMFIRHLKDIDHELVDFELHSLAAMTEQWSGSALENLAREAVMRPIRECLHRAAVIRRRTELREQRGGDASGQEDIPESPDVVADKCLLECIQNLRPVTMNDFRRAIAILTGEEVAATVQAPGSTTKTYTSNIEHYDSSSSDDEH
jgi:SpoVK/Ycf46/Vps4 family AAA+-type ATPase